jgi:hypothetical protein
MGDSHHWARDSAEAQWKVARVNVDIYTGLVLFVEPSSDTRKAYISARAWVQLFTGLSRCGHWHEQLREVYGR